MSITASEMGKRGWQAMYKKHGREFLSANGKRGMEKRWGKKKAVNSEKLAIDK